MMTAVERKIAHTTLTIALSLGYRFIACIYCRILHDIYPKNIFPEF